MDFSRPHIKKRIMIASAALVAAMGGAGWFYIDQLPKADPNDAALVQHGQQIYAVNCASCHGAQLEGQPSWQKPLPTGHLPAPPHNQSGHTWHHPDEVLFHVIMAGTTYESDMPAFQGLLSDHDVWATLSFIKSTWPEEIRRKQPSLSPEQKDALKRLASERSANAR